MVLLNGDVDYRARGRPGREQEGRELYEMRPLAEENLHLCLSARRYDSRGHARVQPSQHLWARHLLATRSRDRRNAMHAPSFPTVNVKLSCNLAIVGS